MLAVVGDGNVVSSDDWEDYLSALTRAVLGSVVTRHLVYVEIAAPPAAILRRISDIVRGHPSLVALLSPSTALRFVVSTFSLVNRSIRYFPPEQLTEALVHIHCNPAEQRAIRDALARARERA
ncbi:MAG TPA: hypothetical protein VFZ61_05345 [Polyangiales bacterium]